MAESLSAAVAFGPEKMTLSTELLQALTTGDKIRLVKLLGREGRPASHVAINVNGAGASPAPDALSPARMGTSCRLLGVASNGNTALHLVASRGHGELAALICEEAPSLAATCNRCLDTPLHCAVRAGHREVAGCLLSTMRAGGADEAEALRATNRMGHTALHEAIRHGRAGVVDLLMSEAPELASVTTDDGISPLYLAATTESEKMVRLLLRPSPDGTPSPASFEGRSGRTALHVAAATSKEMVEDILAWKPVGPSLLNTVDSSGASPLHLAVGQNKLDIVELLLYVGSHLVYIYDKDGLFPLHIAASMESKRMIDELVKGCPDFYALVDDNGMNLLHFAVGRNNGTVVRHICENDRFAMLLNATDFEGNTPLHIAVKYGYTGVVSILLQTMSVQLNIKNRDGLTAKDLAYIALESTRMPYFLDPAMVIFHCLEWVGARDSLEILYMNKEDSESGDEEEPDEEGYVMGNGTIASGLIAAVAFAAAVTVPGGFISDDNPHPGTAILARRFAFRAFVVVDTMAFLSSIIATCFLIYGGAREVSLDHRDTYNLLASGLVPLAVQFMIGAFAFGFHLVLGAANLGLIIFVYMVSSASVLFCFPGIWGPFCLGFPKAIWRRAGWRGILNVPERPSGLLDVVCGLCHSPLIQVRRTVCAVLICVTFVVAIALEIALPNY